MGDQFRDGRRVSLGKREASQREVEMVDSAIDPAQHGGQAREDISSTQ